MKLLTSGNVLPVWLVMIIYVLAGVRLTTLLTADRITEPARDRIVAWLDDAPGSVGAFLAEGLTCPWCLGMWVALVEAPLVWWFGAHPVMLVPALVLAFSQVTGMMAGIGRD